MPREDSHLLAEAVGEYLGKLSKQELRSLKVLDMGSGSGAQTENCLRHSVDKKNILCVDIDKEAVKLLEEKGFRVIESNLLDKRSVSYQLSNGVGRIVPYEPSKGIGFEKFELMIFNPPYLPDDENDKERDTSGGKKGIETTLRFLKQAREHLKKGGRIFIVVSSLAKLAELREKALKLGYSIKKVSEEKMFFETLEVWEIWIGK